MSGNPTAFTVRAYEPGDERAILELFARSFHQPRSLAHWQWKYAANPFGTHHISLTFDQTGRLVAQYSAYPVPIFHKGRLLLTHQVGDTMTDPSVRHIGRGSSSILGRTVGHFYQNFCEEQISWNYGFNAGNIQKLSTRFFRSDRVGPVRYLTLETADRPLPEPSLWDRWWRHRYRVFPVERFDQRFDQLFERMHPRYPLLARRDSTYLNWRYRDCPDIDYTTLAIEKQGQLTGWGVFRAGADTLVWGDSLVDPAHLAGITPLLRTALGLLSRTRVEGWFSEHPQWLARHLTGLGFESREEPQQLALMCVPFVIPEATALMRAQLYYTKGDSDLF